MLKNTESLTAHTLTAPLLDPSDKYLPSFENFISFKSKIDYTSAAINPVTISNMIIAVLLKSDSLHPPICYGCTPPTGYMVVNAGT